MQVNNIQKSKLSFKALKVASTQNIVRGAKTNIDIYKVTKEDYSFLERIRDISIKKLCPTLREDMQERWQKVLDYCFDASKRVYNNTTYLAVSNNKLCGIMSINHLKTKDVYLDGICSIPQTDGKKVNLTGQTLLYQLFLYASKQKNKGISLEAIHNGPIDVVKKYQGLGFVKHGESERYTEMSCNKFKVQEQLQNFAKQISYFPEEKNIKLDDVIN